MIDRIYNGVLIWCITACLCCSTWLVWKAYELCR